MGFIMRQEKPFCFYGKKSLNTPPSSIDDGIMKMYSMGGREYKTFFRRKSMKNKFYMVYDEHDDEGMVNVVIAKTSREAKVIGAYTEATEAVDKWTDLRVKAIKGGMCFFDDYERSKGFCVSESGFLYTNKKSGIDSFFESLKNELKKQKRYEDFNENGTVSS